MYNTPLARHDQINGSLQNKAECCHDLALEDITRIINSVSSTETCNSRNQLYTNSDEDKRSDLLVLLLYCRLPIHLSVYFALVFMISKE